MKENRIKSFAVKIFKAPLKRPFITSLGSKTVSINVGITLRLAGGAEGYGEASSSLALAHLSPRRLSGALRALGAGASGQDSARAASLIAHAWKTHGRISPAAAAFECALLEALMKSLGLSLAEWFGGRLKQVESDMTLSAAPPDFAAQAAACAAKEGFRIFKIKVRGDFSENMARVRAVHKITPQARLILDGNQGMSPAGALRLVEACLKEKMKIILLEQPLPQSEHVKMRRLSRLCPVPLAADEAVSTPQEALRVALEGSAQVINIKIAKSGLLRSLEIAAVARGAGLDLMIGCMAETARGLSPSVHLALGTGFFRHVDLDSDMLLQEGDWAKAGPPGWTRRGPFLSLN
ncbi:MAG: hypothetical protein A3J74_06250 [Elusimicrobia bacterium RIFCSPHIGHO2_02_FULL_57_9]|nr:MAG: hypothetical protein A3J74_06250 [Elusimicrobia bacterium RIFCSPHIGHO2_02_FULL_57_9]